MNPSWLTASFDAGYWVVEFVIVLFYNIYIYIFILTKKVDEEPHEFDGFTGPRRSRLNAEGHGNHLLQGVSVFISGDLLAPDASTLSCLARLLGATVVDSFTKCDVCISTPQEFSSALPMQPLQTDDAVQTQAIHAAQLSKCVSSGWLIDSISAFEKRPLSNYQLS